MFPIRNAVNTRLFGAYEPQKIIFDLSHYFDFEAYGRDISINENGHFAPGGYVTKVSDDFREVYHGPQDIPAGHRVFAYPQLSIREQMAAYQEIIDGSSKEGFRRLAEKHHEER